jgi:hypothetical protein
MVNVIDPLKDPRWRVFIERHDAATVFHSPGWLGALQRTYKFTPLVYTTAGPGEALTNGLVACNVDSWLTGRRTVSLPFSDHCSPLAADAASVAELLDSIHAERRRSGRKFVEIRPLELQAPSLENATRFEEHKVYYLHIVDLSASLDEIFRRFGKSERNAVARAGREHLRYVAGHSAALLKEFYQLFVLTRRRHGVPPQPFKWFCNLAECLGDALTVRLAYKDDAPVTATVTVSFKDTIVYKYGCSDHRYNSLGGTPFLCWKAIEEGKRLGARRFDLGRSNLEQEGLISFKERLGGERQRLVYYRDNAPAGSAAAAHSRAEGSPGLYRRILPAIPDRLFILCGELLYKHVA